MISIVMTTYNGEKYIEEQLKSIFFQSMPADEIIICDDCSSDKTVAIINSVVQKYDMQDKVKAYENKENLGYIRNFYQAISLSKGDYIFLSDQDDIWDKDKVRILIKLMEEKKLAAICTNYNIINHNGEIVNDKERYNINLYASIKDKEFIAVSFWKLVWGNVAQGCTYCFTREVKELYLKIKSFELIHDYQIMIVASLIGEVVFYNKELINYRLHNSNAIGFESKESISRLELRKPRKKPFMVSYFEQLNNVIRVPNMILIKIIYYLRLPYFASKLR